MAVEKIQVPDLGGADEVEVIEVLVAVGDEISENDSMVVLESDKAATEIPAPKGGVVKEILVKVGDKVSQGSPLLALETAGGAKEESAPAAAKSAPAREETQAGEDDLSPTPPPSDEARENLDAGVGEAGPEDAGKSEIREVTVPDLGGASDVEIIDILVAAGDEVKQEDGLITLETDKAAMDVPSPAAGKIVALKVKKGDKVSQGTPILDLETSGGAPKQAAPARSAASSAPAKAPEAPAKAEAAPPAPERPLDASEPSQVARGDVEVYAGPAVRKLARELGVDLRQVKGSGTRGRVVKEDVHQFVKARMQGGAPAAVGAGAGIPAIEDIDFSRFGEIEEVEMSKLHQVTAVNMSRAWLNVPHVTQFDEADVTELENFREAQKKAADKQGVKLTPLPFIVKACATALEQHPQFNVSLHSSGKKLIRKKYVHIGVAVATSAGLMVPVIRDANRKSVLDIAREVAELSDKAKERRLSREQMEGACFTVSSLGNIGGTGFTPIVNAPEVAILGVSRTTVKPVYLDGQFVPRKMLPFALSYDHRAVNGVDGGLFCTTLASLLGDIRLMLM